MLGFIGHIWSFWLLVRRGHDEPPVIKSVIEAEGGDVLEFRQLGGFKRSPFHGLRLSPIIYEFRVQYGHRCGRWFVRTSKGSASFEWVWSDEDGCEGLPVHRDGAVVDNEAIPVGWFESAIVVFGLISIGLLMCIAVYWLYF